MKVTLIAPTLNEIEGMKEIMPRVRREWFHQLIIVDGGSTDGTVEYAKAQGYSLISQKRRGMRQAYMEALAHVDGDILITFSPDGNCLPERIPALIDKIKEGYDMVVVSRYAGDARSEDDTPVSGLANKVFTWAVNTLFRAHYTDAMNIFRAYRKDLISDLDLDKDSSYWPAEAIFRTPMSWEMLLSIRGIKRGLKVAEIPGDEPCRIGGRRRLHVMWGLAYILQLAKEVVVWR